MIIRDAQSKLSRLAQSFKAVAVIGPRQSGKTTLVRYMFPDKPYVSLENPNHRQFAIEDPIGFLKQYPAGAIFDEVQRTPLLFSYLQQPLDESNQKGLYILTGSNNFLLQENITQSLAGRVGYLSLLPFSIHELSHSNLELSDDNEFILKGTYPPVYDQNIPVSDWYPNYIRTYIERDVRQIKNVTNLIVFERFISILAGRCSQELNMSAISSEVGVEVKTIQSWIGILESSFIIFLLKPYHKNFNKTIIKRPKLYFNDVGLVCSLLGIKTLDHLTNHPLRGALFECMVVSEIHKSMHHLGKPDKIYYWRTKTGQEIDVIAEQDNQVVPIEIKSSQTIQNGYFKNLQYWNKLSGINRGFVFYGGAEKQNRTSGISVLNWSLGLEQFQ